MIAQIKMRRGTTAEWAAASPVVLAAGEPGYDTTEKKMKVGDGATEWADLDFLGACPYEVGDILTTINTASPAVRWPGTVWAAIGAGRVLVGIDPNDNVFDVIGKKGGAKTHALQPSEGPAHNHIQRMYLDTAAAATVPGGTSRLAGSAYLWSATDVLNKNVGDFGNTVSSGSGTAHNNLQPYEVVYRYKRTA